MSDIYDSLITDRTRADANAGNEKGTYRAEDLNRVEQAVAEARAQMEAIPAALRSYMAELGVAYDPLLDADFGLEQAQVETKTDWDKADIPEAEGMKRYLDNVAAVCTACGQGTSGLPKSMEKLTWSGANRIEGALQRAGARIQETETERRGRIAATAAAWEYSGGIYAAER